MPVHAQHERVKVGEASPSTSTKKYNRPTGDFIFCMGMWDENPRSKGFDNESASILVKCERSTRQRTRTNAPQPARDAPCEGTVPYNPAQRAILFQQQYRHVPCFTGGVAQRV